MKNTSRKIKITYGDLMNITAMSIETITGIQGRVLLSENEMGVFRGIILHWRAMASQFGISMKSWTKIWTGCVNKREYRLTDSQGEGGQITYNISCYEININKEQNILI